MNEYSIPQTKMMIMNDKINILISFASLGRRKLQITIYIVQIFRLNIYIYVYVVLISTAVLWIIAKEMHELVLGFYRNFT